MAALSLWNAEIDEDIQDVDLGLTIGTYGQNGQYDEGILVHVLLFRDDIV